MTEKKPSKNVVKKVIRDLPFKLSGEELLAKGKLAADKRLAKMQLAEEFDRVKSNYKGQIETIETDISQALRAIREGEEVRTVECEELRDFNRKVVEIWYDGAIKLTRAMDVHEQQMPLPVGA